MKRIIKEYFTFTRSERTGIFVLLVVLLVAIVLNFLIGKIDSGSKQDFTAVMAEIEQWEKSEKQASETARHLFAFDPNKIDPEALDSLDLPYPVKRNWLRYRESGGKIKSPGDFRKIYGMNDSIFSIISGYIVLAGEKKDAPDSRNRDYRRDGEYDKKHEAFQSVEKGNPETNRLTGPVSKLELNSADSLSLVTVNGIGPVLASRIIKYRNLLGGYYSTRQLREVYGLSGENYEKINEYFIVDTLKINKIRINFSEFSGMIRHPYLSKSQVSLILKSRTKNGPFRSGEDLIRNNLLDSISFQRISFYLTFD